MSILHSTPIVLFVHARPSHVSRTLEGLRLNAPSLLYIFSDGARESREARAVDQVREIARSVQWVETRLIERDENYGLARSIISGLDEVFETHDQAIILEDDCVPGPGFLNFMESALSAYRESEIVASVSGYGVPIDVPADYPFDGYFAPRVSSWGWATWRRAWRRALRRDLPEAAEEARRREIDLTIGGSDFAKYVRRQLDTTRPRDIWTPMWGLGTLLEGMRTLWATRSFVQNIGHDGSGENSGVDSKFDGLAAERTSQFRLPPDWASDPALQWRFARFYDAHDTGGGRIASGGIDERSLAGLDRSARRDEKITGRIAHWIEDLFPGAGLADRVMQGFGKGGGLQVLESALALSLEPDATEAPDDAVLAQWREAVREGGAIVFVTPTDARGRGEFAWDSIESRLRGHGLITTAIVPLEDGEDLGIASGLKLRRAAPIGRLAGLVKAVRRGGASVLAGRSRTEKGAARRQCLWLAICAGKGNDP